MTIDTILNRSWEMPWQIIDGKALILSPKRKEVHELNETATWLWQKLGEPTTLAKILDDFMNEYEIDKDTACNDMSAMITQLKAKGLVYDNVARNP